MSGSIQAAKDRGMEIAVADIEQKTPFASLLDSDGSLRNAWAEEFAGKHSWVPVLVNGMESWVRIKKGDAEWKDIYQHNWDATTAYLNTVKPEIPPGTRYSSHVLLRDALSTPANEIIPQHMRQQAFQRSQGLHSERHKNFPGEQKRGGRWVRFAGVLVLLMTVNTGILSPHNPIRINSLTHQSNWSGPLTSVGGNRGPGLLYDPMQSAIPLEETLAAADKMAEWERADVLKEVAQAAGTLKDTAQATVLLQKTLTAAEKMEDERCRADALTEVVLDSHPPLLCRLIEENPDPNIRRRVISDIEMVLNSEERVLNPEEYHLKKQLFISQITPSIRREALDDNEEVRAAVESLAGTAGIPLPTVVERLTRREITFTGVNVSDLFWFLLLVPEFAVLLGFNALGGAFKRETWKENRTSKVPKMEDSKVLVRAAAKSLDPADVKLLCAMSLKPEDVQRVMPERLASVLDIPLQNRLVAAFASLDEAILFLTALANRWEALNTELKPDDVRQQVKVLQETLRAIVQLGDPATQEDARRCLTKLEHFKDSHLSKAQYQGSEHRMEVTPTLQPITEQADSSIESESSNKIETAFQQHIQEQFGSQKPENQINCLS